MTLAIVYIAHIYIDVYVCVYMIAHIYILGPVEGALHMLIHLILTTTI